MLLWIWNLNTIRLSLIVVGLFCYLLAGLTAVFYEKKLNNLSFLGKAGVFFYVFFYFYGLIVNQFGDGFYPKYFPNLLWDSGFFFIGFGCLSFIKIGKKELKWFVGFYLSFFLLDIIITAPYLNPAVAFTATDRRDVFRQISEVLGHSHKAYQLHVILSRLALVLFALTVEYIKEKKWVIFSALGVVGMLFLGLFYQKRNVFLELGIFSVFFIFIPSFKWTKLGRNFKILGSAVIVFLIGLYFSNSLINSGVNLVIARFTKGSEKEGPNERLAETYHFFEQYDPIYYLIGRGLSSFVPGTEGGNNLHLGMGNFILKGGYFMLGCVTLLLILNIIISIRSFFLKGQKTALWIQCYCLVAIYTYSALWGWFPNIMYLPIAFLMYDINRTFKHTV